LEVYFDESGQFGAPNPGEDGLAVVVGVIIPENHTEALRRDFLSFAATLPKNCFRSGEPKGHLLSAEHHRMLATILNAHRGVMFVPVTVNKSSLVRSEVESWPAELRQILEKQGGKCLYDKMRSELQELAKRCGNLNIDQLNRLFTYTVTVREAISGIALFYHWGPGGAVGSRTMSCRGKNIRSNCANRIANMRVRAPLLTRSSGSGKGMVGKP
jgi:hypothetical protein